MGNRKKKIPSAAYRKSVSKLAALKSLSRKSSSGTIGELARASIHKKPPSNTTPAAIEPQTNGSRQPRIDDSMNAYVTPPNPAVAVSAPSQSTLPRFSSLLSGTCHTPSSTTAAAIGTLMKNTHRHDACWINHPPNTGPIAVVIAVNPDHIPIARPRSFSSNDALMIDKLPGTKKAAPSP